MQTNKVTDKPFAQVAAAIQALDLESVKLRLMDPDLGEGWTREYADSVESAYKTFLTMAAKYQDDAEEIMLSRDVDEFWHTHILQTMKYADDCQRVFGAFLHHAPHVGKLTADDHARRAEHAEKTRALYEREFGGAANAESAWAGRPAAAFGAGAAVSNIAVHPDVQAGWDEQAAVSNIAIRGENAAVSNIAIRGENAAVSNIAIRAEHAAVSNIAIRADHAAVSNIAIRGENAAVSNIAIRAENAAVSNIAVQPRVARTVATTA